MAMGVTMLYDKHIRIDIITLQLPQKIQLILRLVTFWLVFVPFVGAMLWSGTEYAAKSWMQLEHSWSAWKPPLYPFKTIIPLAGALPPLPPKPGAIGVDPARTDPARAPLTGPAAPMIPREQTLKMIDAAKAAGYDYLKTIMNATPGGPEIATLKFIVEEGRKRGMPTITHAVSIRDTLAAVEGAPALLVHTPHIGDLGTTAQGQHHEQQCT